MPGLARRILLAALAALGASIAASRLGTLLHEVLGHLLVSLAAGGRAPYLQVTLMGGGHAGADHPDSGHGFALLVAPAGMIVNALAGAISLGVLAIRSRPFGVPHASESQRAGGGSASRGRSLEREPTHGEGGAGAGGPGDLFLRVFAAVNTFGALHYAVAGSYYGHGDSGDYPWLWPFALAAAAPAYILALAPLAAWVRARVGGRTAPFAGICVLAALGYGALFLALSQDFAAIRAREVAVDRAVAEARRQQPSVAPGDVKKPFPIEIPLAGCYIAAVILAPRARRKFRVHDATASPVRPYDALIGLGFGALALLLVAPLKDGVRF